MTIKGTLSSPPWRSGASWSPTHGICSLHQPPHYQPISTGFHCYYSLIIRLFALANRILYGSLCPKLMLSNANRVLLLYYYYYLITWSDIVPIRGQKTLIFYMSFSASQKKSFCFYFKYLLIKKSMILYIIKLQHIIRIFSEDGTLSFFSLLVFPGF